MQLLDALTPFVMPHVKNCPSQTALHHMREALISFCTKTLVWRPVLADIPTVAGTDNYAMVFPANSSLVKLLRGWHNASPADVVDQAKGMSSSSGLGKARIWTEDRKRVQLAPAPSAAGMLRVMAALKPTREATDIDDALFDDFAPVIADGALASLLSMADVSWANPAKSAFHQASFRSGCSKTAARAAKSFSSAKRSTKPFSH